MGQFRDLIEGKETKELSTSKSPVQTITVHKYKDGSYGILNFSMNSEARQWLIKQGFKYDRHTNYPVKNYKSKEELDKDLEGLFGIKSKLVEGYRPNAILLKIEKVAKGLGFTTKDVKGTGQGATITLWNDEDESVQFDNNIDFPSAYIDSSDKDILKKFAEQMKPILKEYNGKVSRGLSTYDFDLTKD